MTTATLRTDGFDYDGIFDPLSVTGASTVWEALEDDSDSSYCYNPDSGETASGYQTTATTTLPTGSVIKQFRTRMRSATVSNTPSMYVYFQNPSRSPSTFCYAIDSRKSAAAGIADTSGYWVPADGVSSCPTTQAELDAVRCYVVVAPIGGPPLGVGRIYEAYLDMVYVEQPVVSVTAVSPDPYTASNIVPIEWANTLDSDGGSQTRYQLKVFTDAQYGAGGFDPDTSTAYYDSGIVASASGSASTGPLATSDTYRAYVRTAQTVNGVSHWSDWDYDTFQVSVSTADVDTVAAVATDASGLITVTVERDTGTEDWDYIEVQRSFDSGTTWEYVRGANYVDATGDADTFVIVDYETGNGQDTLYRARATRLLSSLPITGEWVEASSEENWSTTLPWLKAPLDPTKNLAVDLRLPFEAESYSPQVGVFNVLGSTEPVAVADVLSAPSTTLYVHTDDETESNNVRELLRQMLLFYCPTTCEGTTATRYLAVTSVAMTPTQVRGIIRRVWGIGVVETAAPADLTAGQ